MKKMFGIVIQNIDLDTCKPYIFEYLTKSCNISVMNRLLAVIMDEPATDPEAFSELIEKIVETNNDNINKKILKCKLMNISTEYVLMFQFIRDRQRN